MMLRSIIAGFGWGILMAALCWKAMGVWALGNIAFGPIIGLAVGIVSIRLYSRSRLVLAMWSILSLYLASGIFSAGLYFIVRAMTPDNHPPFTLWQEVGWAWFGLSVPSFFWLLFPLAFVTHLWVRSGTSTAAAASAQAV